MAIRRGSVLAILTCVFCFVGSTSASGQSCDGWILRATTGPSPRYGTAMAYDSARGVSVLFGGYTGTQTLDDTWEWDGNSWTFRTNSGPSASWGHAMVYDSARAVTVLFAEGETWEWDG